MSDQSIKLNSPVRLTEITEHSINTDFSTYPKTSADNKKTPSLKESGTIEDKSAQDERLKQSVRKYASYEIYHPTGYVVVRIINADTGEVLAQYPPTAAMDKMTELEKQTTSFNESE